MKIPVEIFKGTIEGVFGYGIVVFGRTKEEALKLMRKEYAEWRRRGAGGDGCTFKESCISRGATIEQITVPSRGYEGDLGVVVWEAEEELNKKGGKQ